MQFGFIFWWTIGGVALPLAGWAQGSGEGAEVGAAVTAEAKAQPPAVTRSELWLSIDSQYRQRDATQPAGSRRLTAEQRHQLREQIRRTSVSPDAGAAQPSPGPRSALP